MNETCESVEAKAVASLEVSLVPYHHIMNYEANCLFMKLPSNLKFIAKRKRTKASKKLFFRLRSEANTVYIYKYIFESMRTKGNELAKYSDVSY
jgi:hypothetical protein